MVAWIRTKVSKDLFLEIQRLLKDSPMWINAHEFIRLKIMSLFSLSRPKALISSLLKFMLRGSILISTMKISPFYAGMIISFVAVLAQAYLGYTWVGAYGFCMVGHPRDFIRWGMDNMMNPALAIHEIPLLTSFGVILGSLFSSIIHKEFRFFHYSKKRLFTFLILGFVVINFGLIAGACPIRLLLTITYGDLKGVSGLVGYVGGIALAVYIMRR